MYSKKDKNDLATRAIVQAQKEGVESASFQTALRRFKSHPDLKDANAVKRLERYQEHAATSSSKK